MEISSQILLVICFNGFQRFYFPVNNFFPLRHLHSIHTLYKKKHWSYIYYAIYLVLLGDACFVSLRFALLCIALLLYYCCFSFIIILYFSFFLFSLFYLIFFFFFVILFVALLRLYVLCDTKTCCFRLEAGKRMEDWSVGREHWLCCCCCCCVYMLLFVV